MFWLFSSSYYSDKPHLFCYCLTFFLQRNAWNTGHTLVFTRKPVFSLQFHVLLFIHCMICFWFLYDMFLVSFGSINNNKNNNNNIWALCSFGWGLEILTAVRRLDASRNVCIHRQIPLMHTRSEVAAWAAILRSVVPPRLSLDVKRTLIMDVVTIQNRNFIFILQIWIDLSAKNVSARSLKAIILVSQLLLLILVWSSVTWRNYWRLFSDTTVTSNIT